MLYIDINSILRPVKEIGQKTKVALDDIAQQLRYLYSKPPDEQPAQELTDAPAADPEDKPAYRTENPGIDMQVENYHINITAHKDGSLTIKIADPNKRKDK